MYHNAGLEFVCTRYCHLAVCYLILLQIAKLVKIFRLRQAVFSDHNRESSPSVRNLVEVIFVVTVLYI